MKAPFKAGSEKLKQHFHLMYGIKLNETFVQHELEKDEGKA